MIENIPTNKWTDAQIEVWDTVVTYTNLIIKGNKKEFLEYIHEDFSGWNNIEPLPIDKQSIIYELKSTSLNVQIGSFDIIPIKINIHNGIAIVHYYFRIKETQNIKKNKSLIKHYTDVLLKKNARWVLIADHFGLRQKEKQTGIY